MTGHADLTELDDCAAVLARVPEAVAVVDVDTGEIIGVNDRATEMLGRGSEALVGQHVTALHPDEDRETYASLYRSGAACECERFTHLPDGSDLTVETAVGERVPIEIHCQHFEDGGDRLSVGIVREAADRRESMRQVRLLRDATDRLLDADSRKGVARLVAEAVDGLFGYATSVVRLVGEDGQTLRAVAAEGKAETGLGDRPVYPLDGETPATQAYRQGTPIQYDDVSTIGDGHDRGTAAAAMYVPIADHGVVSILDPAAATLDGEDVELVASLAASAQSILDRIAHERELERQNERLDEFASLVSHDLQNPLSVARTNLSLARTADENDHLDAAENALGRIDDIVEDTLTLAREETAVGDTAEIPIWDVTAQAWQRVDGGDCQLDVVDTFTVQGDRERLSRLFENLLRNSVEHGSGTHQDDWGDDSGDGATVRVGVLDSAEGFYVEDDGPGLPDTPVFEPGHTTSKEGTGFGLSIVRQVATAHGWTVRTADAEGGGARFEFVGANVDAADEG